MSNRISSWGLALAVAAAATPVCAQTLSPQDIKDTWVGKTLTGSSNNGVSFELKLAADGSSNIVFPNLSDTGTWRLSDDGYCATWKVIRKGAEACFTAVRFRNGEIKVMGVGGSASGYITKIE